MPAHGTFDERLFWLEQKKWKFIRRFFPLNLQNTRTMEP